MCISSSIREEQVKSGSFALADNVYHPNLFDLDQYVEASHVKLDNYHMENNFHHSTRRTQRRVHFDVDKYDAIIEYRYVYPKNECTNSYTSENEEGENTIEMRRECRKMRKRNSQLIRRLNGVYENEEYDRDSNIFNDWVASDLRGFESTFLPKSQFHTRDSVKKAIIYYRRLQEIFSQVTYNYFENDIDDILHSFIMNDSQRSSEIAIQLAAADEIEAQKHKI